MSRGGGGGGGGGGGTGDKLPSRPKKPSSLISSNKDNGNGSSSSSNTESKKTVVSAGHQIYRALYDYKPSKEDELELSTGQLYVVAEKCRDGWFKGTTVEGLKSGVFPGNYVQHIAKPNQNILQPQKADSATSPSSSGPYAKARSAAAHAHKPAPDDLIDLSEMSELLSIVAPSPSKQPPPPPPPPPTSSATAPSSDNSPTVATGWATFSHHEPAPVVAEAVGRRLTAKAAARRAIPAANPLPQPPALERYRCLMSFPSSSQYELDLKEGDVVILLKRREDGWCKGTLERTGQTGLFPLTFVHKIS